MLAKQHNRLKIYVYIYLNKQLAIGLWQIYILDSNSYKKNLVAFATGLKVLVVTKFWMFDLSSISDWNIRRWSPILSNQCKEHHMTTNSLSKKLPVFSWVILSLNFRGSGQMASFHSLITR